MSSKIIGRSDFGRALSLAIGEDPSNVRKITLESAADAVVMVTIEKFVTIEQAERILTVIKKYAWVEDEEETDAQ